MDMVLRIIVGHIFLPLFARWINGLRLSLCCVVALGLWISTSDLATAQTNLHERYYFPLIGSAAAPAFNELAPQKAEDSGSTAEAIPRKTLSTLQGILRVADDGSLQIDDPWGHTHRIVGSAVGQDSGLGRHNGQFVILTGRRLDDAAGSVFITQSARALNVDPTRYAAYVQREMSDPALRPPSQPLPKRGGAEAGNGGGTVSPSTETLPQHLGEPEGAIAAAVQANPAEEGEWSAVQDIGMYALHAVLRPDGKVMFWYRTIITNADDPIFNTVIWDPVTEAVTSVPNYSLNGDENWCAAHSYLGDGRLFAVTGDVGAADPHADILDYSTNQWTKIPDLNFGRYYPSTTYMADGRVVVAGGDYINPDTGNVDNPFPEVWEDGQWRKFDDELPIEPTEIEFDFYYGSFFPWTQQTPDGRIFYAGPQSTLRYIDPDGGGTVTDVAERDGQSRDYGSYATFDVGKVLIAGGGDSLKSAYVIDYNPDSFGDSTPSVSQTGNMNVGRRHLYTTILADGTVLVTGGNKGGGVTQASAGGVVKMAELWDPETGEWTEMASMAERREYHSSAILLPDARVVHAGGDCTPCDPQTTLEVFSPPYLYNDDGSDATRPTIENAPIEIDYGQRFNVSYGSASAVSEVNLIRLGSSTHSTNFDQRLIPLSYTSSGSTLSLTGPKNAYIATPGYYMLFLISDEGVPSEAKIIKVGTHIDPLTSPYGLTNGDFESGTQAFEDNLVYYDAGDTIGNGVETGWTVESGDVDVHHNTYLDAGDGAEGDQHLDIHGTEAGQISQPVTGLTVGEAYVLEFLYSVHPLTPWAAVTVEIDGQEHFLLVDDENAHTWQMARIEFTASSGDTVLRFSGHEGLTYAGMLLDDISVEPVETDSPAAETGRPPAELAVGQPASQSSAYAGSAGLAVDGNTNGSGQANEVARTDGEIEPWWQVDLGQVQEIDHVVLWPQTDCCADLLHNFYILISETDLTGRPLADILDDPTVMRTYIAKPVEGEFQTVLRGSGRYVRIQSAIPTSLSLAEVKVFSPPLPNRAPTISSEALHIAQLNEFSSYQLVATDPDGHTLNLTADGLPSGLGMDAAGLISGTLSTPGVFTITVTASDDYNGATSTQLNWVVNQQPYIVAPGPQQPTLGSRVTLPIVVSDLDGDGVSANIEGLPAGLAYIANAAAVTSTLDAPLTLLITGTVTITGTHWVTVTAEDNRGGFTQLSFEWMINSPPTFASTGAQIFNPGEQVYWLLEGSDPDGDDLTFSADGLPTGLEILPQFGLITGTTEVSGLYTVTIQAEDGVGGLASDTVLWRINMPPLINDLADQVHTADQPVSLQVEASDPDGDSLTFTTTDLPPGLTLGTETGVISGEPSAAGVYTSTITVEDSHGLSASDSFRWQIDEPIGQPPVLTAIPDQSNSQGDTIRLPVIAVDADSEELTFIATGLPDGITIDPNSGVIQGTLVNSGDYSITVTVEDSVGNKTSARFTWSVTEKQNGLPNVAPVLAPMADIEGNVGDEVEQAIRVSDSMDDVLSFEAEGLPVGLTINSESGVIRGTVLMQGSYLITVTVTDAKGESDSVQFTWIVAESDTPAPPTGENDAHRVYLPMLQ